MTPAADSERPTTRARRAPPRRRRRARRTPSGNVPPYLNPGEIAAACHPWSRKKVLRELETAGLLDQKRGAFWRISATALEARLPEIFDRVFAYFDQLAPM